MSNWTANTEALNKAISQLAASKETRGIKQKGGKKYTVVADRVEAFRNHLGDVAAIQTEIVHYDPKDKDHPIVVKACIYMWDNGAAPRLVATGYAEEWRAEGYVNATSALENCETSAIGRALANLGLHGGEYASANEIDIAVAKRSHLDGQAAPAAPITVEVREETNVVPFVAPEPPEGKATWETMVSVVEAFLPACTTQQMLKDFWERNLGVINELREKSPKDFASVKAMVAARKTFLKKEETNGV